MAQIGTGKYTYEVIRDFFKSPDGEPFGLISRVAADDQDRIYVFQRRDPPVVVFDRDGKYLALWGSGRGDRPARAEDRRRHGLHHRPLRLGREIVHARRQGQAGARHGGPAFRYRQGHQLARRARRRAVQPPDRDAAAPQRRHLRHRRLPQRPRPPLRGGRHAQDILGLAGQRAGPVPPAAQHRLRRCRQSPASPTARTSASRSSRRTGEYLGEWTGMGGPNDISRGKDGNYYIAEQEDDDNPAYCHASATRRATCSPRWRAATSTASASTRAATSTPA